MNDSALAVELKGIWKRFPGVIANSDINLSIAQGTVHAIVGENGAGKSTLMKILYGMQKPDEGTITINGDERVFESPSDAIDAGIGMVHQHFMLADNFTVIENIILGSEPRKSGKLDLDKARQQINDIAAENGLAVDPDALVADLGVGDRQRIEILKVLYRGARILILDEPTAVLVPHEVDELFDTLRDLKREGITIMFISHKLDEVLAIADEITVIRQGTTVGSVDTKTQQIQALRREGDLVWFDFKALCDGPRSQNDYLEIANRFDTVFLSNVPQMSANMASQARRFTWLVDVLYDRRIKLVISAQVPAQDLYLEGPLSHEFPRTVSRLREMQSSEFLALEKRVVDTAIV